MDGGLVLAPDDQVWSAVSTGEGSREAVGLVGEVHCDLLLGGGVAASELIESSRTVSWQWL